MPKLKTIIDRQFHNGREISRAVIDSPEKPRLVPESDLLTYGHWYYLKVSDGGGCVVYKGFLSDEGDGFYLLRDAYRSEHGLDELIREERQGSERLLESSSVRLGSVFLSKRYVAEIVPVEAIGGEDE